MSSQSTTSPDEPGAPAPEANRAGFQTTIWPQVLRARDADDTGSRLALESLCRRYWFPIYSYVRRRGHSTHDAEDLTQGFFSDLLAKNRLQRLKNRDGRFRSFLLISLRWFLANEWDRAQANKRGGALVHLSLEEENAEGRFLAETQSDETPEHGFDRQFARAVLRRALARLRAETDPTRFSVLGPHLMPQGGEASYLEAARELGMTETAVKSAVRRLRRRCGELFREEIDDTVISSAEGEDETRYLLSLLAGR